MVQTIRDLGIEYVAANPGSSFEGLQESFINYGNPPNQMPEFITALHEESAVTMAHGYAKAEGKPMLALLHGTIGIQHAAMSIYQAYYDRVPVLMIAGNDPDFIAAHTAHDMAGIVRSYHEMGRRAEDHRRGSGGHSARLQRSHHAADGADSGGAGFRDSKGQRPEHQVPAYKPPTVRDHRLDAREGDREGSAGGSKPQDRGGTFANAGRREAVGRTGRTGGSVHQHGSDERAHEFPATACPLRPRRGHGLRLHARS